MSTVERRDVTSRGRAIRSLIQDAVAEKTLSPGVMRANPVLIGWLVRAYDAGALDKSAELVAEFQAVIDKLRADITQDKPAPLRGGDGERT